MADHDNYENARTLVNERAADMKGFSEDMLTQVVAYLDSMWAYLNDATARMPTSDISYEKQDISLDYNTIGPAPDPPSDDDLTPDEVTPPDYVEALEKISINSTLALPDNPPAEINREVSFTEVGYASTLLDAVLAQLEDWIENGGTGLGADVEDALWERDLDRVQDQHDRDFTEVTEAYANMGWSMPHGMELSVLGRIQAEHTRNLTQRSHEITIEEARLAQTNTHFATSSSIETEKVRIAHHDTVQDRALRYAIASVSGLVEVYNAKMQRYIAELQASEISAKIEAMMVEAKARKNAAIADIYRADIAKYSEEVKAELGLVETIAKVYGFRVQGYEAASRAASMVLQAQIEEIKARIQDENNQTQIDLKEAELALTSYLKNMEIHQSGMSDTAKIAAQIAASALQAFSASASLSYSQGFGHSKSETVPQNQEHTVYHHSYNHS